MALSENDNGIKTTGRIVHQRTPGPSEKETFATSALDACMCVCVAWVTFPGLKNGPSPDLLTNITSDIS